MVCVHRFLMDSLCPENGMADRYEVEMHTDRLILCESLLEKASEYRNKAMHQEKLTAELADHFRCKVVTTGQHCNGLVTTRVEC